MKISCFVFQSVMVWSFQYKAHLVWMRERANYSRSSLANSSWKESPETFQMQTHNRNILTYFCLSGHILYLRCSFIHWFGRWENWNSRKFTWVETCHTYYVSKLKLLLRDTWIESEQRTSNLSCISIFPLPSLTSSPLCFLSCARFQ